MVRRIVFWILVFTCLGSIVGDPGRVLRKKIPIYRRASSFSDLVFGNKVIDKKPKAQRDKYEFRQNYLFHKSHLRGPDSGRKRVIHKPIKNFETFPTLYKVDPKDSLNIDQPGSPYGLIHKIFSNHENEIAVTKLEEIPHDLDPDEVWLSDGNLLVLKGGYSKSIQAKVQPLQRFQSLYKTRILSLPRRSRLVAYKKRKKLF